MHQKILSFAACREVLEAARRGGKRLVHCHGTFDLLHPGHLKHLEEAKKHGDLLVVTITSAPFVNKGPGRPVFGDEERAYQLAHLALVDYVVVVPHPHAIEAIEQVRPDIYCKGTEYASPQNETDRRIDEDAEAVGRAGGRVVFVGEPLHSSTKLIASHFDALDPEVREYLESIEPGETSDQIDPVLARIASLRVLVLGDLIVDRYTYGHIQGLTAKAKVLSLRRDHEEDHLGGALAVARHLASFHCKSVRYLGLAGTEPWLDHALQQMANEGVSLDLIRSPDYQTVLKQRFVERPGKRKDLVKLFAVNHLADEPPASLREELKERIAREVEESDLVVLCDYGHGFVDPTVQKLVEERARWVALNCQSNSYNYGFNLITKYHRCDLFTMDENELRLATGKRDVSEFSLLSDLTRRLGARQGWLTLGSSGSLVCRAAGPHSCPAMVKSTVDTVGAGDAFFATAALCARVEAPIELTAILANLSGAVAANIVGNKEPIRGDVIVKNARYLLKSARPGDPRRP
jgi:rfaE bifunctional protein kinase chain/domain/rfaE bifunctional protein nucleotidyltransferase chain/domain